MSEVAEKLGQQPGQPAEGEVQPQGQTSEPASGEPQNEPQGEPQGEPHWKSQYDKLYSRTERALKLEKWFNENQSTVVEALQNHKKGNQKPDPSFNVETDFDITEALTKPDSPSAQVLDSVFEKKMGSKIDELKGDMREQDLRGRLAQSGLNAEDQEAYWTFLNSMEDNPDLVFGPLAKAWRDLKPSGGNLQPIRDNKSSIPSTAGVPSQPAQVPDKTDDYLDGIMNAGQQSKIKLTRH